MTSKSAHSDLLLCSSFSSNSVSFARRLLLSFGPLVLLLAATAAQAAPPTLTPIDDKSMREGASLNIPLNASDTDGDGLSFSTTNLPSFCSLTDNGDGTGAIDCTPSGGDATTPTVTVTVTDDSGDAGNDAASDDFVLTVTANAAPVLANIGNQTVAEGDSLNIPLSALETDGDSLSFSESGLPGFCSLTDNGNGTGSIACNPTGGDGGGSNVTITVTDDAPIPGNDFEIFTLSVTSNSAPVLTNIDNQTVAEGESLNIPLSAMDSDGDGLSFSESGLPGFCSLTDNGNGTGSISCNPTGGDGGSTNVTIIVTDDASIPLNDFDNFTLTVSANSPPVLTDITDKSVIEEGSLNIPLSAMDADGDNLSFSTLALPGFCLLTDNGNGTGSIVCNPLIGDNGSVVVTVTVTDDGSVPASSSDPFTLTVDPNLVPTASAVSISGTPALGEVLSGTYTYADAEGDVEGISTYRWLRDGIEIPGAAITSYTVVADDIEAALRFEVTPVAATGVTTGLPVQSADFLISNSTPSITGQVVLETPEDTPLTITLADLTVVDADSVFPDEFTLTVQDSLDYTRSGTDGNTVTPLLDFNGLLTVLVTVNDGFIESAVFNLLVTVTPINDQPMFFGLVIPLTTLEDGPPLLIVITDLIILDPDNVFPDDFTLTLEAGLDYTLEVDGITITPDANFNGQLNVGATVSDFELTSPPFVIVVDVGPVNDMPVLVLPIGPQDAVEGSPFNLDVSANFSDADGEVLNYTASWLPQKPPNINFNGQTGVFSGTPGFADTEPPGPVYQVTVTALDPIGDFVSDTFELTISALGRANLRLAIDVTPDTAMPGDEFRWTFTSRNPVGPVAGANVELRGSFVGDGLTVTVEGGANCTVVQPASNRTNFTCTVGGIPVGGAIPIIFTTSTSQVSEVLAFATVAGTQLIPIDPNLDDNSALKATGVAESFSVGAVQVLGNLSIRSLAAGDINGDGVVDLVVGTAAGQPVQVYLGDIPTESCQCQRDFLTAPITVPDTGSNEGVALAHFNADNFLDLVIANGGGQADTVYRNDGAGNFTLMATLDSTFSQDVAVGDFDSDGDMDIAIAANGANPVYLGNGNGGFSRTATLGNANSVAVAVARFDSNSRDDLVFANVGSDSRVWTKNSGSGFKSRDLLSIGDAAAVAAADLNNDGRWDLVFGRVATDVGDIPSNPVLINQGSGTFGNPMALLGISPTNDVLIGDVNDDGLQDLVFINASGVHQIWTASGGGYVLHREQIIENGAVTGVLADLGFTDNGDPGGIDLAMGGPVLAGVGVYLNDSFGNLGRGDAVAPVLTLLGEASVSVASGTAYNDAGTAAEDNIDGNISASIIVTGAVNLAVVGSYTLTYNVVDFAGNPATPVTRNVSVTPNDKTGGGGAVAFLTLILLLFSLLAVQRIRPKQGAPR